MHLDAAVQTAGAVAQAATNQTVTGSPLWDLIVQQTGFGLVAAIALYTCYRLALENKALRNQIDDIQKERLADKDVATKALLDMNSATRTTTDQLAKIADALAQGKK